MKMFSIIKYCNTQFYSKLQEGDVAMNKNTNTKFSLPQDKQLSMIDFDVSIQDVIDLKFLQEFQDNFAISTGVGALFFDKDMKPVTNPGNFGELCNNFFRKCEKSCEFCIKSDKTLISKITISQKPFISHCENGLIDFGTPVLLNGKNIGTLVAGQVFINPPDKEKYREYAKTIGADVDMFMKALDKVPVISEKRVNAILKTLTLVGEQLSEVGYQQLMIIKSASELRNDILNIMSNIEAVTASASETKQSQESLNNQIYKITHVSEEINSVMDLFKDLARNTKLLGLNASIEAARAGESGSGFTIVAKEIQKLSDRSNETINKIKVFNSQIKENVSKTLEISNSTVNISVEQEKAMKAIVNLIENVSNLADQLNKMAAKGTNKILADQKLREMY